MSDKARTITVNRRRSFIGRSLQQLKNDMDHWLPSSDEQTIAETYFELLAKTLFHATDPEATEEEVKEWYKI